MKKLAAVLFVLLNLGFFSASASADTLQLVSTGGQSVDGVNVYPYNFSINGSTTLTPLMCLDFAREITQGETWSVTESGIPLDNSQSSIDYRAAAIISFEEQTAPNAQAQSDYQFAAWSIFNSSVDSLSGFTQAASNLAALALADATSGNISGLPGFSYANFTLYIPTSDSTGWTNGIPQEFIGNQAPPVPEPSSLLLLGTGVIGMAAMLRRRGVFQTVSTNR